MKSSDSKKLTLIYLQELFLKRTDATHGITMNEIQDYLQQREIYVDRRTVYTDMKLLNSVGFEIIGSRKRDRYEYYHTSRLFDHNELKFLVDAVAASKFLTEKKSTELIKKIKSLGSRFDSNNLNRGILVSKRIKSMNDIVLKNLDLIYLAIANNSQIAFQYTRWKRDRTLNYLHNGDFFYTSPFAVTLFDDYYYLISYDAEIEHIKHYRLDKMVSLKLTNEPRIGLDAYKSFDISDYARKTFNMYGGEGASVVIEIPNILAGVFFDRFGDAVHIRPNFENEKKCFARVSVNISPQFYAWIFGLGRGVKIISPENVKQEYTAALSQSLELHTLDNP